MRLWPPASTAMVPVARLARWAAASMPRASPDTTAKPASPSSRASRPANLIPAAEALRAPTTAIIGRASTARWPRTRDERRGIVDHRAAATDSRARPAPPSATPAARAALISRSASAREQMRATAGAAAARQAGQRGERGLRAAELVEQRPEGARPDILAANEPQPVEPLLVGQPDAVSRCRCAHAAPRSRSAQNCLRAGRRQSEFSRADSASGGGRRAADLGLGAGEEPRDVGAGA